MKIREGFLIVIAVVLSELMLAGIINTGQDLGATGAQAKGFDALAHEIFSPGTR
jgi:outer membrane murein-binding lipoprotein Lpp